MIQKPRLSSPGASQKAEVPPAPRRLDMEHKLCNAIKCRFRVLLRYEEDILDRVFEPAAVYWSETNRVLVSGIQISNANEPGQGSRPHNFEVGLVRWLVVTEAKFIPDPRFDPSNPKYAGGIICSV